MLFLGALNYYENKGADKVKHNDKQFYK